MPKHIRYQFAPDTAMFYIYCTCSSEYMQSGSLCALFTPTVSLSMEKAASVYPQHNKHIGYCEPQQYRVQFGMLLLHPVPSPSLCPTPSSLCTCLPPTASLSAFWVLSSSLSPSTPSSSLCDCCAHASVLDCN